VVANDKRNASINNVTTTNTLRFASRGGNIERSLLRLMVVAAGRHMLNQMVKSNRNGERHRGRGGGGIGDNVTCVTRNVITHLAIA